MKSFVVFSFVILSLTIVGVYCGSNDFQDCHLPLDSGYECPSGSGSPPDPNVKYYFANFTSGFCEEFSYKGCGGNTNRFTDVTYCESYCATQGDAVPSAITRPTTLQPQL
ncbi:hypothetical protein PVAND_008680 [Polypedilum vanderplanki]|uniref:BPTI/Kunitz inhibitor domain-containing protein n=1 Tax=Polypedilum vanderplanki TaxID=319348 RepID=A0A9J6CB01_POLVA|nr:hypothetical protein PVAND_008680 [Polypedilum vanderplanki]